MQDRCEVEPGRLPVVGRAGGVQRLRVTDRLVQAAEAERRKVLPDLLGDVGEEGLDELRLAVELLAQLGVLGRDAHRAGVEVADPHHDAPADHQRGRREAVLLGTEQRGDDHVPSGLELAVGLHDDPVAQPVEQQRLLGLGEPELPRRTGMLEAGERRRTRTPVVARDEDHVGVRLADAGSDRADSYLRDQLDVDPRLVVGVLQVVDQLGEVLDGVDVVVRRRRDEADARRGEAGLRDPRVDLVPRQLTALPGLRSLGHLDLQVVGVDEVLAGHAEAAGRDLLDGRPPQVAVVVRDEAVGVLAALAGVGLAAQPVHRDRQGLVRLLRDRAVGHRTGREPPDDRLDRLDLVEGHRRSP